MGRPRAFDWDEAARLYAECRNYSEVARRIGVSGMSVRRALNPSIQRQQSEAQKKRRAWVSVCVDCGGPATRKQQSGAHARNRNGRCKDCADLAASESVRPDTLRCCLCRLWLPDDAFPRRKAAKSRRGRHSNCTACGNVARRDYRAAHREQERERDRERKRRERAARRLA